MNQDPGRVRALHGLRSAGVPDMGEVGRLVAELAADEEFSVR